MKLFSNLEEKVVKTFDGMNLIDQMRFVILDATFMSRGQRQFIRGFGSLFNLIHQHVPLFNC